VDKLIKIWDIIEGKAIKTLVGHLNNVRCLTKLNNFQIVSGS